MIDPKLLKCEVCGVPWEHHTPACVRHGFQPRGCECGWEGVYAECPIINGALTCPDCGRMTGVKLPDELPVWAIESGGTRRDLRA